MWTSSYRKYNETYSSAARQNCTDNGLVAEQRNPFEVLGLPPTATSAQVKASYRRLARQRHPDAGGDEESFRVLKEAAARAGEFASGARPNPYLPTDEHTIFVPHYDRHAHAPKPPPNIWRVRGLFWILPVAGAIFLLSALAGPYFLPVWVGSTALFGVVVWLALRRSETEQSRPDDQHCGDAEEHQPGP